MLVIVVAILWLGSAGPVVVAAGLGAPATISGRVADETGGMLPGATLVLRNAKTGRDRIVVTDAIGRFVADQLVPG